jgi:hypothetical protein
MKVIVDSREQAPFTFEHERYAGTVLVACLGWGCRVTTLRQMLHYKMQE